MDRDIQAVVDGIKKLPADEAQEVSLCLLTYLQTILWRVGGLKANLTTEAVNKFEAELLAETTELRDTLLG